MKIALHQWLILLTDIGIFFNQSTYDVNENDGTVKLVLILSKPSSTAVTVQIRDNERTATSKCIMIFCIALTIFYYGCIIF